MLFRSQLTYSLNHAADYTFPSESGAPAEVVKHSGRYKRLSIFAGELLKNIKWNNLKRLNIGAL